ncbi:MAG: PaaI family thioesterase [Actinomycetota bacterium]
MSDDRAGTLSSEQLERLARYFDEAVTFSRHIGAKVVEVEPGHAVCRIEVEELHLNGNGTLHGGVYASLIDNAMGLAVSALVGLRTATIALNVHFLGAVREGTISCESNVVHRTRRLATVEASVRDDEGNLVAMGTGTFRIFEKRGDPIV